MNDPLPRQPLSLRLADRIEAEIKNGAWVGILPGYRTLAARHRTSLKTCMAALELLEKRRVVQPVTQGKRRRIAPQHLAKRMPVMSADEKPKRNHLLILSSEVPPLSERDWFLIRAFGDCWMHAGGTVTVTQVDFRRYQKPTSHLKSLIERYQATALLLYLAPKQWPSAAVKLLPLYLGGGEGRHTSAAGNCFRLSVEVPRVLRELEALGHQRVLLPLDPHLTQLHESVVTAYRDVFGPSVRPSLLEDLCPFFSESVAEVWQGYWDQAFSRTDPTAVILLRDAHVISLYSYCFRRRIEIPRDLSIVNLGYSDTLSWLSPTLFQMRYPARRAIAHFREWVRGGLRPTGMKDFELEKVPGASMGPARKTSKSELARPTQSSRARGRTP